MTERKRAPERTDKPKRHQSPPTWRNTQPRGNPETHAQDLARSVERFEAVLGR
jgi:hypothetical protein